MSKNAGDRLDLLTAESATGAWKQVNGGFYTWQLVGTVGGAACQLQIKGPDPAGTPIDIEDALLTDNGILGVTLPNGASCRVQIAGGSPSALYSALVAART